MCHLSLDSWYKIQKARDSFAKLMIKTKREDWSEWLLEAGTKDLWTANRYIRDPVGDGGRPRIPSLLRASPTSMANKSKSQGTRKRQSCSLTHFFPDLLRPPQYPKTSTTRIHYLTQNPSPDRR